MEMTEAERKGIRKGIMGLVVSGIIIVILVISSLWLYAEAYNLQRQVSTLQTDKNDLQTQVNSLATEKTNLQNQISDLQTKLTTHKNLHYYKSIVSDHTLNQGAGSKSLVTTLHSDYAGYVDVSLTSTTTNAYVEVQYSWPNYDFYFKKTLGTSGWEYFCVLPATIYIYVGNTNLLSGATHTISISYYY